MIDKTTNNIFKRIMDKNNTLLEAGIIDQSLQLRLTVSEHVNSKKVYVEQLKSLQKHEQLKESFETLSQMFLWMADTKNIEIDFSEISVVFLGKHGFKIIELGRVMLKELELI